MIDKLIKDRDQLIQELYKHNLNLNQIFRISLSQKRYLLIYNNKIHLTDHIKRLIKDNYNDKNIFDLNIYMIN